MPPTYGNGKIFVVPYEKVGGVMQGGMCALPIPPLPTGVMRGRFHPKDGQLYACGMYAWAGDRTQPSFTDSFRGLPAAELFAALTQEVVHALEVPTV